MKNETEHSKNNQMKQNKTKHNKKRKENNIPSPLISNMAKASLRSAICSSDRPFFASSDMDMVLLLLLLK
jgi:hypothetical protein